MENFKTVAIFTYPSDYAVLRLLLEHEHIRHVFQNETMISVLPFHSNAIGGIRLKVHVDDILKTERIIANLNDSANLKIV
ncbi:DUF2007 domain-containing protein [Constantimarinum furrinae]|uniref:DUF2007 domain-containing protein n=1 Tax=Constantimarinum furrinae TaxID=2562285 RepID=A0A7G8PT44_9FLAO|nr:DUF2007 domain-containing protein [Constantimarinum furrinae]QNJ97510.1 hypothetical protein ALE3EI_0935 [Constantimarinum furrinae]